MLIAQIVYIILFRISFSKTLDVGQRFTIGLLFEISFLFPLLTIGHTFTKKHREDNLFCHRFVEKGGLVDQPSSQYLLL